MNCLRGGTEVFGLVIICVIYDEHIPAQVSAKLI